MCQEAEELEPESSNRRSSRRASRGLLTRGCGNREHVIPRRPGRGAKHTSTEGFEENKTATLPPNSLGATP